MFANESKCGKTDETTIWLKSDMISIIWSSDIKRLDDHVHRQWWWYVHSLYPCTWDTRNVFLERLFSYNENERWGKVVRLFDTR